MAHMLLRWSILATVCTSLAVSRADGDSVHALYEAETQTYRAKLEAAGHGDWLPMRDPHKLLFFLPPPEEANPAAREIALRQAQDGASEVLDRLRRERAETLFALAKHAVEAGECTTAVQLAYETLHEQPDHAAARKLLGYRNYNGRWLQEYETAMARAGSEWHPKFGWLKADQVARYEAGERFGNNRWVSAAEDAKIHATIGNGWEVQTEHFRIRTNHSLEKGVELAGKLEAQFHVWRQLFARYYLPDAAWKRFFAGADPGELPAKKMPVVYFRSRDEYVAALKRREPQIEITSGIFMIADGTAYFYADDRPDHDSFLHHEVTHELFALMKPTSPQIGAKGNFWITEGVACYFESLALHDDYAELGGLQNIRLLDAWYRLLKLDEFVPLAELTALSKDRLQQDPRIKILYAQSSGLCWFLLQADSGGRREAVVEYLNAIYAGKDDPTTLAGRLNTTYAELDEAYRRYMQRLPMTVEVKE